MTAARRAKLWIGPSGWSYDDWAGVFYPRRKPRGFKPLTYLSRFFNAVEVNSSFYRIPSARMTAAWPKLVPPEFRFALKLTQTFTHQRGEFPDRRSVEAFNEALRPIGDAGLLGPLLMQFPWSFRYTSDAVDWLRRLVDAFPECDRFVEVRHASWAQPEAVETLKSVGGYCNIDQPRLRNCLGPTEHVLGANAYVRLHGRNAKHWFADNVPAYERYNYLYDDVELREWVRRIDVICEQAENTYVFANNHYRGQAVAAGLQLMNRLTGHYMMSPGSVGELYDL